MNTKKIETKKHHSNSKGIRRKKWKCDIEEYFFLIAQQYNRISNCKISIKYEQEPFMNNINQELDWKSYLLQYLASEYEEGKQWVSNFYYELSQESFYSESILKEFLTWEEFEIKSKPKCLVKFEKINFYPQSDYFTYEIETKNKKENPTNNYQDYQENVYNYIRVLKRHIIKKEHPINFIIKKFVKYYTPYLKENVDNLLYMKINDKEKFSAEKNNMFNFLIEQIKNFIIKIEDCIKLYYSEALNPNIITQEKDEVTNLITGLVFKEGNLYKYVINLITLNQYEEIEEFKSKLNSLVNITPKELDITDKFCLDSSSIAFYQLFNKNKPSQFDYFYKSTPYADTINLFQKITIYKKPYDKLLLISQLSKSISNCVNEFWVGIDGNVPMNKLGIEADDLMSIFSYIIIKSQMENLVAQMRFIKLFTSIKTQNNLHGYFYSTIEVCIMSILNPPKE